MESIEKMKEIENLNDGKKPCKIRKMNTGDDDDNNDRQETSLSHDNNDNDKEKSIMAPQQQHKQQQHKQQEKKSTNTTGIVCQFCNNYFASKNLVFRHLRDASTTCGNTIIETGQKLPDAPSKIKKHQKKERAKALRTNSRRKKTGKAKQNIDPASTLWFGDLPLPYTRMGGQYKRLRAVLKEYLPRDVPQPWIKKVVRKGYRKGGKKSTDENERGDYYGYAIIVFRDAEEANNVMTAMDGTVIESKKVFPSEPSIITPDFSTFVMKVNNVQHNNNNYNNNNNNYNNNNDASSSNNNNNNNYNKRDSVTTSGDHDPPLIDQLRPLSTPELQERCQYMKDRLLKAGGKVYVPPAETTSAEDNNSEDNNEKKKSENYTASQEHDKILELALSLYDAIGPRQERLYIGRVIPESIRENLLHLLKSVRWPAESHRKGLTSDNYLVLQTNITKDRFYNDLRLGCRELMDWVDPNYYYSGIAVTKNFVASPHIDDRDQSFQYAVSLGEFNEGGGELCVEGNNNNNNGGDHGDGDGRVDYVNVVETRNRIAKVDGRNVHWVRSWNGTADRYSLIFYDTTDRHQTDIINTGVDVTFLR